MNWDHFLTMGGYALYVWTAYGLMAAVLLINLILALRRGTEVRAALARRPRQEPKQTPGSPS